MAQFFCFLLCTMLYAIQAIAQPDDKKAFASLKALQGDWEMQKNDTVFYEKWNLEDKNSLKAETGFRDAKGNHVISFVSIDYSKAVRFNRISAVFYHIHDPGSEVVYPFRLESVEENRIFTFSNFNNPAPNAILYILKSAQELEVQYLRKDGMMIKSFLYQRVR